MIIEQKTVQNTLMSFLDGPKIVHTHRDCSSNKICFWQRTHSIHHNPSPASPPHPSSPQQTTLPSRLTAAKAPHFRLNHSSLFGSICEFKGMTAFGCLWYEIKNNIKQTREKSI